MTGTKLFDSHQMFAFNKQRGIIVDKRDVNQSFEYGKYEGYSMTGHMRLHYMYQEEHEHRCRLYLRYCSGGLV